MTPTFTGTGTGQLSRVTLAGRRRRVDLVLPSDEPLGVLLPEIVAMVGYGSAGGAGETDVTSGYQVSTVDGSVLDLGTSLRSAGVADGTLLRVDPLVEAPPAAIVHNVSDEVADDLARRHGRWNGDARTATAIVVCAAAATMAAILALPQLGSGVVSLIGGLVALAGLGLGLLGSRWVGVATLVSGAAIAMTSIPGWTGDWAQRFTLWTFIVGCLVVAFGAVTGNLRVGVLGGNTALILLAGWTGLRLLDVPADRIAAVMAIASIGVLGLLPRLAMMASGLTRLDDLSTNDEPVSRTSVAAAVDSAHRGLAVACVVATASAALSGWVLAGAASPWTIVLAALVAVTALLRMRAFPLVVEMVALIFAALVIGAQLLVGWIRTEPGQWWGPAASALGVAAVALAVLAYRPPPHVQARLRQHADRLEAIAVVALVPVAVGVFQVYPRLLDTF